MKYALSAILVSLSAAADSGKLIDFYAVQVGGDEVLSVSGITAPASAVTCHPSPNVICFDGGTNGRTIQRPVDINSVKVFITDASGQKWRAVWEKTK